MKVREYAFDVKLVAAIRVKAVDALHARELLGELLDCASANLGAYANGDPIICEVSLDADSMPNLYEIDGEPT